MKIVFRSIYPNYILGEHRFENNLLVIEDGAEAERLSKVKGYGHVFFVDEALSEQAMKAEWAADRNDAGTDTHGNDAGKVLDTLGLNGTRGDGGGDTRSHAEGEGKQASEDAGAAGNASTGDDAASDDKSNAKQGKASQGKKK